MFHILAAFSFLLIALIALFFGVLLGRRYGLKQIARHKKLEIVTVAEGAVFGLLALLVAFTFSGSYDRFEKRKLHIVEEANAYSTAYMRVDLLDPKTQPELRKNIRLYLDARIKAYKKIPHLDAVDEELTMANDLENKIWDLAIAACKITHNDSATQLLIPAINDMFDNAHTGFDIMLVHSPAIIFILLIGLAIIGSFLAGYSTAESKRYTSIHILSYVVIVTFTVFLILNLEFPRVGIVRVDAFDKILIDVERNWQKKSESETLARDLV